MTSSVVVTAHCADSIQVVVETIDTLQDGTEARTALAPLKNGQCHSLSVWDTRRCEVREEPIPASPD